MSIISGLAAASRIGAPYPFPKDNLAEKQFRTFLNVVHGVSNYDSNKNNNNNNDTKKQK